MFFHGKARFRLQTPGQRPGGRMAISYQSPALMNLWLERNVGNYHFRRYRQNELLYL
jgi:hypothetical protein